MNGPGIPERFIFRDEQECDVVYLFDIPEVIAHHLEHMASQIDPDVVPMPGNVIQAYLLGEVERLRQLAREHGEDTDAATPKGTT